MRKRYLSWKELKTELLHMPANIILDEEKEKIHKEILFSSELVKVIKDVISLVMLHTKSNKLEVSFYEYSENTKKQGNKKNSIAKIWFLKKVARDDEGLLCFYLTNKDIKKDILSDLQYMFSICEAKSIERIQLKNSSSYFDISYSNDDNYLSEFEIEYAFTSFRETKWVLDKIEELFKDNPVLGELNFKAIEFYHSFPAMMSLRNGEISVDFMLDKGEEYPFQYLQTYINLLTKQANEDELALLKAVKAIFNPFFDENRLVFLFGAENNLNLKLLAINKIFHIIKEFSNPTTLQYQDYERVNH